MVAMFRPAAAISWEMPPTMLGTLALAIATRHGDSRGSTTSGKLTALPDGPVDQVVADLVGHHHRAVLLRFPGGGAEVRQHDHPECPFSWGLGKSQT